MSRASGARTAQPWLDAWIDEIVARPRGRIAPGASAGLMPARELCQVY